MKIKFNTKDVRDSLQKLRGVIAKNPIVPILGNVLFKAEDEVLKIYASDMHLSMCFEFPIKETFSFCVDGIKMSDVVSKISENDFEIEVLDLYINVKTKSGKYKLPTEPTIDYPKLPTKKEGEIVLSELFCGGMRKAIPFINTDDIRPAMTGILVDSKDGQFNLVATNGQCLIKKSYASTLEDLSLIIPSKACKVLCDNMNDDVTFGRCEGDKFIYFSNGNKTLFTRTIDERFPEYQGIVPKLEGKNNLVVYANDLLVALNKVKVLAPEGTFLVVFKRSENGNLEIKTENIEYSFEAQEEVAVIEITDELDIIGFDLNVAIKTLSAFNDNNSIVTINYGASNRAVRIHQGNENEYAILMPRMI